MKAVCVLLLSFLCLTDGLARCPFSWVELNDFCYAFFIAQSTWDKAKMRCEARDSRLVQDDSEEKHEFIVKQLKMRDIDNAWVGLRNNNSVKWVPSNEEIKFKKWFSKEPNFNPACVSLEKNTYYKWTLVDCDKYNSPICEKSADS